MLLRKNGVIHKEPDILVKQIGYLAQIWWQPPAVTCGTARAVYMGVGHGALLNVFTPLCWPY
jgi:hypothetical protein